MVMYSGIILVLFVGLLLFGCRKEDDRHSGFLSLHETQCLKGVFALEVVLCHIYAYYREGIAMKLFNKAAYISVAMFFLFAGYGLVVSVKHKKDYLNDYLINRLSKLYIPLWLSLVFSVAIRYTFGVKRQYTATTIIKDILGLNAIWFFAVIVVYYVVFYFVWKWTKGKNAVLILSLFTVLQCIVCAVLQMNKQYYTSSFGFILGMLLAEDYESDYSHVRMLINTIKGSKFYMVGILLLILAISVGFLTADNSFIQILIFRNLFGIVIISTIVVFLFYYNLGNNFTEILGRYSYEIYLIHPVVIVSVKQACTGILPSGLQVMIILTLTFVTSVFLGIFLKFLPTKRR